jgi:hypothetical protein
VTFVTSPILVPALGERRPIFRRFAVGQHQRFDGLLRGSHGDEVSVVTVRLELGKAL